MLQGWVAVGAALGYIGLLFLVASYGDRAHRGERGRRSRLIYPLSLAIYCTSWTFFGSVGLASRSGFDFLAIYLGPVLLIGLASPLVIRVVRLAKSQNITSIADFIAARYGKNQAVAATVAVIAIAGSIPYIALQLKAVSASLGTILAQVGTSTGVATGMPGDIALFVAISMAAFAVLFGTRHVDATEHQDGLILAVAAESVVKLLAFLAVGVFVTFVMFGGPVALFTKALENPEASQALTSEQGVGAFLTMTLLSAFAIILLPRQFHVAVVENNNEAEVRRAAWLFPLYLVLINLFVVPIALAGLLTFPAGAVDSDMYVLALPLRAGSQVLALVAFIGGLSAATAMVIVETVALAIMVSNDLVMPLLAQRRQPFIGLLENVGALLLRVRRFAILAILLLAYLYHRSAGFAQLASIGLLSFAAIAQLAPAFFGGLFWPRATARGAVAGMIAGFAAWAYTMLLPSFVEAGLISGAILADGPWGLTALRPQALFGLELSPFVHGVVFSLGLNVLAYVGFSLSGQPSAIERLQADIFVPSRIAQVTPSFRLWRSAITVGELTSAVARYLGEERTRSAFASFAASRRISLEPKRQSNFELLQYAEHLLASAIGAASSRLVLSLLLRKRTMSTKEALRLLDDANAVIHYNREILQTALDHVRQGIAVFNEDMTLLCWNRQFGEILELPEEILRVGITLDDILRLNAETGAFGPGDVEALVRERAARYATTGAAFLERFPGRGLVIEVRANQMPGGGFVTTLTDITPSVEAAEALARANDELEHRVRERTAQLERLNTELAKAKAAAESANLSKTRFLAAASHDLLQPLNAARLYATSLVEQQGNGEEARLAGKVDASLEAVEEILGALLDISRLDAGAMHPELAVFRIDSLFRQLEIEFAPLAREKGLRTHFRALLARGALRPAPVASDPAEPGVQCHQIYRARRRGGWVPAPRRRGPHRRVRYRNRHCGKQSAHDFRGVSPARSGGDRGARARARPLDRRAHRPRSQSCRESSLGSRARLPLLGRSPDHRVGACGRHQPRLGPCARSVPGCGDDVHRQRADCSGWDGVTARRLGVQGAQGPRPRCRRRSDHYAGPPARCSARRLPSRYGQRHRRGHRTAEPVRRRPSRHSHHRGSLARGARRRPRP